MIGQTLSHYRIVERLGEGGMGVVYKAEDTKLARVVALKFLRDHLLSDAEAKQRFLREAQAAAGLFHANICPVYEIDELESQVFIAMAFLEGQELARQITAGPLKLERILDLAIQIAEALQEAHRKGVVHRDIKPANIMVTTNGQAVLMDFGLAQLAAEASKLTKEGTMLGTSAYMSPEQTRGEKVDRRADIWALGVVLYEMTTGQVPFRGHYEQAILYSILNEDPEPITRLRPGILMELEHIIDKCLAKGVDERYQSVNDLLGDLRAVKRILESKEAHRGSSGARETTPSIAVLPFVNMNQDEQSEFFSDGLTEELINALAQLEGLRVVSRTSVFRFKGKAEDMREVGEKLQVSTVLEGSVRQAGKRLRVTAQLIDVVDGCHLWSQRFDREMQDVFEVQDEITQAIVEILKVKLAGGNELGFKRHSENLDAYNLYLKGRYYLNKRTAEALERAIEYFGRATSEDATYALAYAGLADCYTLLGSADYDVTSRGDVVKKAREAVEKALRLGSALAEGHASQAFLRFRVDWDWSGAEQAFQRAVGLSPNSSYAHHWYAMLLIALGRVDEAVAQIRRAQELDPLSLIIGTALGRVLHFARRFEEAIEQCQKVLDMDPGFAEAHLNLGMAYAQRSMFDEATSSLRKASSLTGERTIVTAVLANVYAVSGRIEEARNVLDRFQAPSKRTLVSPVAMALVHAGLGEEEHALDWLLRAYQERSGLLVFLKVEPMYDVLRSDPRLTGLLEKMGLR